jgi:peptidyl-prolyl cis-trans isomerase B (cyclophilin B)
MTDTTPPTPPAEPTAAPAYAQQPYAAGPKTNVLAIISLVLGIIFVSIGAVITGHIALSQIKKRGEGGQILAIIGLILGYLGCLVWIGIWAFNIWILVTYGTLGGSMYNNFGY